jgi:hypothetical protein
MNEWPYGETSNAANPHGWPTAAMRRGEGWFLFS